jgi:lysophospholipase L1-like esterase
MRFLKKWVACAALFLACAARANATLYPNIPLPLPPANGGLGPASFPGIQSGDFVVGFGDSLIANTAGSNTCATGTAFHTPTGTCMLDKVGEDTGAQVSNLGLGGTCLQVTSTVGGQCNSASSGYARYTNAYTAGNPGFAGLFTHDPLHEWVIFDYGTNDWTHADAGATAGSYYTEATTIIQYLINTQHILPSHIRIVGLGPADIYGGSTASQPQQADMAIQAAIVAAQNYTTYAETLGLLTRCWSNNTYTTDTQCTDDGIDPNAAGSALIATSVENANYQSAIGAIGAYASLAVMMHQPLLISPHIIGTPNFGTPLSIGNGGTGSASQNFVDLSTTQASIGGNKTFTGQVTFNGAGFIANPASLASATDIAAFKVNGSNAFEFLPADGSSNLQYVMTPTSGGNSYEYFGRGGTAHYTGWDSAGAGCPAAVSSPIFGTFDLGGTSGQLCFNAAGDVSVLRNFVALGNASASSDGTHISYVGPSYFANGNAVASTFHCVNDVVTASGIATTVTLSGAAAFTNANYPLFIEDDTGLSAVLPNAQTASSFTFVSINAHVYSFQACHA